MNRLEYSRENFFGNGSFLKQLFVLALPVALQQLVVSLLGTVDILLISGLGDTAISAVSMANQVTFVLNLFVYGISSCLSAQVSQYRGKKDIYSARGATAFAASIVLISTTVVFILVTLFPKVIMSLIVEDPATREIGAVYLSNVGLSYVFGAVTALFAALLRCCKKAKYPLIASIIALTTNTLLNYLLINGIGFFPRLEVQGAAIATVISRILESGIVIFFAYTSDDEEIKLRFHFFRHVKPIIKSFIKLATPILLQDTLWGLGVAGYSVIYGWTSVQMVAAVNIAMTLDQMCIVVFHGMSNAAVIIMGNTLGARDFKKAKSYSVTLQGLALVVGIGLSVFVMSVANGYVHLFFGEVHPDTQETAVQILFMLALFFPFRVYNYIAAVGILRSGGDNVFGCALDLSGVYLIGLPLGFITAFLFHAPPAFIIFAVYLEEFIKSFLFFARVHSCKWVRQF